jgi:hypothetical protein
MPINNSFRIDTTISRGGSRDTSSNDYYFNTCGESKLIDRGNRQKAITNGFKYSEPLVGNIDAIYKKLVECINNTVVAAAADGDQVIGGINSAKAQALVNALDKVPSKAFALDYARYCTFADLCERLYEASAKEAKSGGAKALTREEAEHLAHDIEKAVKRAQNDVEAAGPAIEKRARFHTLLTLNFNYQYRGSGCNSGYNGTGELYQIWKVRPHVEALFIHDNNKFRSILKLLIEKKDPDLCKAFLMSLKGTDLEKLPLWNEANRMDTLGQITKLSEYGIALKNNKDNGAKNKGNRACEIAEKVMRKVVAKEPTVYPTTYIALLETMLFKLDMAKELRQSDKLFDTHRGILKFLVTNICVSLLTLGIANLINYRMTGHVFFSPNTETQQRILNVQRALKLGLSFEPTKGNERSPSASAPLEDPEEPQDLSMKK